MTTHVMEMFDDAKAITPSDTVDISSDSRGLWVGGAGNLAIVTAKGNTVTFTGVPAGTLLKIGNVRRVNATNTTATNIVALY